MQDNEKLYSTIDSSFDIKDTFDRKDTFEYKLEKLLNAHSKENGSDTPDFILANYLIKCLEAFNEATTTRSEWYKEPTLMNHMEFMRAVSDKSIILCNEQDSEVFTSWKVGGQDFYAYGIYDIPKTEDDKIEAVKHEYEMLLQKKDNNHATYVADLCARIDEDHTNKLNTLITNIEEAHKQEIDALSTCDCIKSEEKPSCPEK
jgi:hypothetical protein